MIRGQVDVRDQVQRHWGRTQGGRLEPLPRQPSDSEGRGSTVLKTRAQDELAQKLGNWSTASHLCCKINGVGYSLVLFLAVIY